MAADSESVILSDVRKEPSSSAVVDNTLLPGAEKVDQKSEISHKKTDSSAKKPKVNNKKPKKHAKKDSHVSTDSDSEDADDATTSDDDATESDSDNETKIHKKRSKKGKKHPNINHEKGKEVKNHKKKAKSSVPDSESESDDESDSSDDDSYSDEQSNTPESRKGINKSVKDLQQQLSQLQSQLAWTQLSHTPQLLTSAVAFPNQFGYGTAPLNYNSNVSRPNFQPPILPGNGRPVRGRGIPGRPGRPPVVEQNATSSDGGVNSSMGAKGSSRSGTSPQFKRVDMVWDRSLFTYKLQDTNDNAGDSRYDGYIFHVRRAFDHDGKHRHTCVDIKSKLLRECLQDVMGSVKGISLVDETPKLDPNILFMYLEDFQAHLKHLKLVKPAGEKKQELKKNQKRLDNKRSHLKVLVKYLNKDYAKIKSSLYPMLANGLITFELLWALWKPGTLGYSATYGCSDVPRAFKVEVAERHSCFMKGEFYTVEGTYMEFDGKRFGYGSHWEEILDFKGAKKITSLPCYPLKYHQDEAQVRENLIERGKKFATLCGVHYRAFSGLAFFKRKRNHVVKFNIQPSRIMTDPAIFRRLNPNYVISSVRPKEHDILSDDEMSDEEMCDCDSDDSDTGEGKKSKFVTKVVKDENGDIHLVTTLQDESVTEAERFEALPEKSEEDGENEKTNHVNGESKKLGGEGHEILQELTDEDFLIASPVVLGFSFSEKQWLEFLVSGVQHIKWNDKAWDSLVLEPKTKDLIQALVQSRKYHAAQTIDDVIQGKGKGLVTVLHGPPGTGKTLTAEGISELLKCPLYMASAGELGTDSRFLEAELQKILDVCHAWGAILLLDEADVFLEKRNMHDLHRNALVSIFLRQLEYFQGILFLTTNRVETFDEAFQSRIHIALKYEPLDGKAKRAIFKMFLDRVQKLGKLEMKTFSEQDLAELAKRDLNGREIKNVVSSAQDLAVNRKEAFGMDHVRQVLEVHDKFGRDLRGGTGYEDAMRSYF